MVHAPQAFPADWPFEGLDATDAYPPFLRPGVLLGFDGLRAFEDAALRVLSTHDLRHGLALLDSAVGRARSWRTTAGPLPEFILRSFEIGYGGASAVTATDPRTALVASATEGSPVGELPDFRAMAPEISPATDLALRKYLGSRLIAAWIMFQADDLQTVMRYLHLCLDTVLLFAAAPPTNDSESGKWKQAVRDADLWILHH
ncbi:MAG: hypothetical protein ABI565_03290, partial [Vicinamibacteria bacterium]